MLLLRLGMRSRPETGADDRDQNPERGQRERDSGKNLTRPSTGGGPDAGYLHKRMPSQLVALATQLRKASGFDELEELDEEPADPHMFNNAWRQLALSRELELEDDPARHV